MTEGMSEEYMSLAPVHNRSCSACLLSNTCFFFLGCRVKGKKECVQGGWEKFEVYARHVAGISMTLEAGLTCFFIFPMILGNNVEDMDLVYLYVFVLDFCL